jgi:hypothetical protein
MSRSKTPKWAALAVFAAAAIAPEALAHWPSEPGGVGDNDPVSHIQNVTAASAHAQPAAPVSTSYSAHLAELTAMSDQYQAQAKPSPAEPASEGFDWGDASVGAGSAFVSSLLGVGMLIGRRARGRHARAAAQSQAGTS